MYKQENKAGIKEFFIVIVMAVIAVLVCMGVALEA